MTNQAELAVSALRGFATAIADDREPDRVCVRLHGADGMASLCAVERAIGELWTARPATELVWLTRTAAAASLFLQAFANGALLAEATYALEVYDA